MKLHKEMILVDDVQHKRETLNGPLLEHLQAAL